MKTRILTLTAALLLLGGFVACNDSEESEYIVIIGQHWMGHPGYSFEKQAVDTESDKMTLNLVYKQLKGGTPAIMTIFYFWGLYDKLPEKTLTVNKIII